MTLYNTFETLQYLRQLRIVVVAMTMILLYSSSSIITTTTAFSPTNIQHQSSTYDKMRMTKLYNAADAWTGGGLDGSSTGASRLASGGGYGSIEQIEFKIYPDGRVEELVRGIKGNNCHSVTQKINEALGEVVSSSPTEELYEQEVTISQTLYNTDSSSSSTTGDWSSTW